MKKFLRPFAVPAVLWALGFGLSLLFGACDSSSDTLGDDTPAPTSSLEIPAGTAPSTDIGTNETVSPTDPPTPTATPAPTPTPTPLVVNTDTSTVTFLVNREYPLPDSFVPADLTTPDVLFPFSDTSIDKAKMTPEAGEALARLFDAAYTEAGLTLYGVSAYRSYARQYTIYATNLATRGIAHTNRYSAAPGRSEHQTGLAIDISCASEGYGLEDTFADTPEGIWVSENAHRFGFILRYPKDKEHITGYNYEPWHIRYVGTELAGHLYETGLTLDEYYGAPSTLSAEYLETTPLIDTTAESYLSIYRQYH
ncbi:MAG: M15 family metallopeptidase [Lachnospiraceae bacterium]|nr:M15 family metallopeptidase [Lachnospiraceae bacterium]